MRSLIILSTLLAALSVTSTSTAQTQSQPLPQTETTQILNRLDITQKIQQAPASKAQVVATVIRNELLKSLNNIPADGLALGAYTVYGPLEKPLVPAQIKSQDLEARPNSQMTCHWSSEINDVDSCEEIQEGKILVSVTTQACLTGSCDDEPLMIFATYKLIKIYVGGDPRTAEKPHDITEQYALTSAAGIVNLF